MAESEAATDTVQAAAARFDELLSTNNASEGSEESCAGMLPASAILTPQSFYGDEINAGVDSADGARLSSNSDGVTQQVIPPSQGDTACADPHKAHALAVPLEPEEMSQWLNDVNSALQRQEDVTAVSRAKSPKHVRWAKEADTGPCAPTLALNRLTSTKGLQESQVVKLTAPPPERVALPKSALHPMEELEVVLQSVLPELPALGSVYEIVPSIAIEDASCSNFDTLRELQSSLDGLISSLPSKRFADGTASTDVVLALSTAVAEPPVVEAATTAPIEAVVSVPQNGDAAPVASQSLAAELQPMCAMLDNLTERLYMRHRNEYHAGPSTESATHALILSTAGDQAAYEGIQTDDTTDELEALVRRSADLRTTLRELELQSAIAVRREADALAREMVAIDSAAQYDAAANEMRTLAASISETLVAAAVAGSIGLSPRQSKSTELSWSGANFAPRMEVLPAPAELFGRLSLMLQQLSMNPAPTSADEGAASFIKAGVCCDDGDDKGQGDKPQGVAFCSEADTCENAEVNDALLSTGHSKTCEGAISCDEVMDLGRQDDGHNVPNVLAALNVEALSHRLPRYYRGYVSPEKAHHEKVKASSPKRTTLSPPFGTTHSWVIRMPHTMPQSEEIVSSSLQTERRDETESLPDVAVSTVASLIQAMGGSRPVLLEVPGSHRGRLVGSASVQGSSSLNKLLGLSGGVPSLARLQPPGAAATSPVATQGRKISGPDRLSPNLSSGPVLSRGGERDPYGLIAKAKGRN